MNKITGLIILLSVAIVLVAPQVFSASSYDFDKSYSVGMSPGYYRSDAPEVMGAPAPAVTCEVGHGATTHLDVTKGTDDYPENVQLTSNCEGSGSGMDAKDIQDPHLDTPEMWNYR